MNKLNRRVWFYFFLILLALISFIPVLWMIITSLKQTRDLFVYPPIFFLKNPKFSNYIQVFIETNLGVWIKNSLIVSISVTIVSLFISILGAYGLSRFRFTAKNFFLYIILATQMFPEVLLLIPIYTIFMSLKLNDSLLSLILTYLSFTVPINIWFLKTFFDNTPREIEEAAEIDGASILSILFKVVIPISLPGLVATGMFSFIIAWNDWLFAATLINSPSKWVTTIGLSSFIGQYTTPWHLIMSAAVIVSLPVVIIFMFLQKYLIKGLTAGSIK